MKFLSAIEMLSPIMFAAVLIGFALCLVSLVRAMCGRRKVPYVSASFLLVPIVFFFISRTVVVELLDNSIENEEYQVTVLPNLDADPKQVFRRALSNTYTLKGHSGSHPTDRKYTFKICYGSNCAVTIIAEDSRDPGMYWVHYEAFRGGSIPLGYTRLDNEEI